MQVDARFLGGTLLVSAIMMASPVAAQTTSAPSDTTASGELEQVVVTARRREENVQTVPLTVSVVPAETLSQRGDSLADLVQLVPGLQENAFEDRNDLSFSIRGQQFTFDTAFPAVITYFAEVPLVRVSTGQTFDLGNIQVLKGPEGTLFGRVTDGGAILLTPQKPTNSLEGYVEAKYGNYNQREITGAINVPIIDDRVLFREAFDVNRRDGFTHNIYDGKYLDDVSYESSRTSLLIKPFDGLQNTTIVNYNHSSENGTGTILLGYNPNAIAAGGNAAFIPLYAQALALQQALGPRATDNGTSVLNGGTDDGVLYRRSTTYVVNTTVWNVTPDIALKNIVGYVRNREVLGYDYDGSALVNYIQTALTAAQYPMPDTFSEQYSDETQIQGKTLDGKLDFTAGTYFDYQHDPGAAQQYFFLYNFLQDAAVAYPKTKERAVYTQLGYDLGSILPGLKVNGGVRYTEDRVDSLNASYIGFGDSPDTLPPASCLTNTAAFPGAIATLPCTRFKAAYDVVTYTAGLDYQINDNVFAYYTQRKGYRPGGVNTNQNASGNSNYDPEFDTSHEIGIKSTWSINDVKFRANLAAFSDNYTDIQEELQEVDPSGLAHAAIVNAAAAVIRGTELETAVVPLRGLTITANWAYLDAHYLDKGLSAAQIASACPANPLTTLANPAILCPNNPLPQTPRNTVRAGVDYLLPTPDRVGKLSVGADGYYVTKNYINGRDVAAGTIPSYHLFNANLRWSSPGGLPIDVRIYVNNLANKTYLSSIDSVLSVGELGRSAGYYGAPRMYGLSVRYTF